MKVLLIEDDAQTASYVARGLRELGHVVDALGDGRDGLVQALGTGYDVLIVDRMLPGLDGLSVVKAIRAAGMQVPILFLSAMGSVNDRVQGLDCGADDYLGKPFSFVELRARLNALLRRAPFNELPVLLSVGSLQLNRLDRSVQRDTRVVELQPREFSLLETLMLHAGQIVTRTMLLEKIWDMHFDPQTNIVESHISRLRAKISVADEPQLIHTVRGAGYLIRAD